MHINACNRMCAIEQSATLTLERQVEMTDSLQHHCSRPWYKRPLVWIVCVVLVAFAVFGLTQIGSRPTTIRYSDFLDQLDAGNVASVTFAGTQIDGYFKQSVGETVASKGVSLTTFRSRVPDVGDPTLFPELRAKHVTIGVASSQWLGVGAAAILGVIAAALLAKPMLLIIAAAFIAGLVRVARGGKMEVKSILSMVPMFKSFSGKQKEPTEN